MKIFAWSAINESGVDVAYNKNSKLKKVKTPEKKNLHWLT